MGISSIFKKKKPQRYKYGRYSRRRSHRFVLPTISSKLAARTVIVCLTLAGFVLFGNLAYKGLCRSDFFRLTTTTIDGCQQLSKEQVLELSGVDIKTNLLAVNIEEIQKKNLVG